MYMAVLSIPPFFALKRTVKRARIHRFIRQGRCACGYDLRGHREAIASGATISNKCPECGRPIQPQNAMPNADATPKRTWFFQLKQKRPDSASGEPIPRPPPLHVNKKVLKI